MRDNHHTGAHHDHHDEADGEGQGRKHDASASRAADRCQVERGGGVSKGPRASFFVSGLLSQKELIVLTPVEVVRRYADIMYGA
jgi:hypothetical protein